MGLPDGSAMDLGAAGCHAWWMVCRRCQPTSRREPALPLQALAAYAVPRIAAMPIMAMAIMAMPGNAGRRVGRGEPHQRSLKSCFPVIGISLKPFRSLKKRQKLHSRLPPQPREPPRTAIPGRERAQI